MVRKEDLSELTPTKNGQFRKSLEIYNFAVLQILRWNSNITLSGNFCAELAEQKKSKQKKTPIKTEKQFVNDDAFLSDSAHI